MAEWYIEMLDKTGDSKYDLDSEEAYAEMLEDLVMTAVNEALAKADDESASQMEKLTGGMGGLGGMNIPGLS